MGQDYKIELRGISKAFPGVQALDDVSICVRRGTLHAVMGENGAGKSTLMKVINGLHRADSGQIILDGREVHIGNPLEARALGIAMIFQELNYFSELTVEENMFMGRFPGRGVFVDWKQVSRRMRELSAEQGLHYDGNTLIKELSVSEIQMLEIVKAVSFNAQLIIMDEPTSSISAKEIERLFEKIAELKSRGISILYISHKLEEIFRIADDITVMRDGRVITTDVASAFTEERMITAMVGRTMENIYPKEAVPIGGMALEIENLYEPEVFKNIGLHVRRGEIVGLTGLVGSGRTELARAVFGLDRFTSGAIKVDGQTANIRSIKQAVNSGVIMLSEDRKTYGIVPVRSIRENISLSNLRFSSGLFVRKRREQQQIQEQKQRLNIKTPSIENPVSSLSGGNQQKVILARWLLVNAKVMILDEPTRGIDVGAKFEIYKIMVDIARQGMAILMISSEMPELIGMCDRMYIMRKGEISGELTRAQFDQELIMKHAMEVRA